eukprot:CFRG3400T1
MQPEQITAEYRRLVLQLHPDKRTGHEITVREDREDIIQGQKETETISKELLNTTAEHFVRVQEAYKVLKNERHAYDQFLCSGLCVPFSEWKALESAKQTTHWHNPKSKVAAVTDTEQASVQSVDKSKSVTREEALRAFRKGY